MSDQSFASLVHMDAIRDFVLVLPSWARSAMGREDPAAPAAPTHGVEKQTL